MNEPMEEEPFGEDTVTGTAPREEERVPYFQEDVYKRQPQGIHIVKVLEQQEILPFERMKDKIIRCQTRRHGMDKGCLLYTSAVHQ